MKKKLQFLCSLVALMCFGVATYAQTDCTAKVGTSKESWGGSNTYGSVQTYAGTTTPLVEFYGSSDAGTKLSQAITGLDKGIYEVTVFATSHNAWGNHGAILQEDADDVAYIFATAGGTTLKEFFTAHKNSGMSADEPYKITISNITVPNGDLTIGLALDKSGQTEWQTIQIYQLTRTGDIPLTELSNIYNKAKENATNLTTETMSNTAKKALTDAIADYSEVDQTSEEALTTAINAFNAASKAAEVSIASYKIIATGSIPDNSLAGWTCENANTFHINTWSGEGNSDGSNMKTPFIENWVGKGSFLGAGKVYYKLEGLEPGEVYYAQALVRSYNEANSDAPNGPNFFVNDVVTSLSEAGTTFTYNGMSGIYATLGGAATVDADGTLTLGVEIANDRNYNWVAFKNVKIQPMADALAAIVTEAQAIEESSLPEKAYQKLQTTIEENNKTYTTATEYEQAIDNIRAAIAEAQLYANAKAQLESIEAALEGTNVYTETAYNTYYGDYLKKYEEGTFTTEDAGKLSAGSRVSGSIPNILLEPWTIGENKALPDDKGLYINTWSVEGDTDGTEFKTPFFEYWTGDNNSLGENTLTATLENVAPGSYEVSAWVRVRAKNGTAATDATGITLSANDGEAVDVTEGEAVGTSQFNIGKYTASATVGEDGILKIKFNVAADNNISWLSFKDVKYAAVAEPATAIVNAEFNPEADPLGWEKVNPVQYYDLGMGLIGTYQVRGEHPAATVDETHPATEYAAGLECRWQTNYAAFTQTTANLPAGYYKLTFDVENTNASTTSAAYENRFTVTVGENVYTDESTEWMNGKSAWTTHTIAFPVEEAAPITISLGYGTGTNNYGVGNTPNLFVSNLQLTTADPVIEAKTKALAKIAALAPVGDALFQYAQADIEAAKAAVEAATTVAEVEAVAMPAPNAPDAEKQYAFQLKLDGETPLYMNLTETGITIAEEATPLSFVETETAGQYNLVADGLYVGLAGGNAWTMSTAADNKAAWTFTALGNDEYYINNLVTAGRFVGTNAADKAAGNPCYADKQTSNGNVVWIITEYVAPTPEPINMTDLTPAMFHKWTLVEPIEVSVENQPCANGLYKQDGSVYGDMSVNPDQYADLSEWDYLTIAATGGVPRLIFNRTADLTQAEGSEAWKGTIPLQIQDTESEYLVSKDNDIYVYDLKAIKEFLGGTVHLNAIKVAGGGQMTTHAIKLSTIQPCIPTWYTITSADGIENGTVSAWEKTVEGAPVKVTATPAEGYELEAINYIAEGEETPTAVEEATFTMPAANVTISATFKKAPEYIVSDLTKEMFHDWSAADATAEITTEEAACDYAIGDTEAKAEGTSLYGNGNVLGQSFADLTGYKSLTLTVESGNIRIMLNTVGQSNPKTFIELNNGTSKPYFSINGNTWTVDFDKFKETENVEYVHLNVIKVAWGTTAAISAAKLKKLDETTPTLYAITIAETENGTVEADAEEAEEGATVTITVTPNDGYMVDEASYSYTLDGEAEPTVAEIAEPEEGNAATITMPAADVTVNITFKAIEVEPETPTIAATLVHTASASWGSNSGRANTVDSEKEYYNNDTPTSWAGAAFAEFSLDIPNGATITKATLNWSALNGNNKSDRTNNVYYLNAGTSLDYTAIPTSTDAYQFTDAKTLVTTIVGKGTYVEATDATDAVKAIAAAKENTIIFQWTGNNGGAELYGKASENAPTLIIEYIPGAPEIANWSFDENAEDVITVTTQGYARNIAEGSDQITGLQPVTGWTPVAEQTAGDPGFTGGVFAYGSENLLNNKVAAPATAPEDSESPSALALSAVWDGIAQYTQEVTLPAGDYKFTYTAYNGANTGAVTKNLFGFVAGDGTAFLSDQKTFPVGEWNTYEVAFTVDAETTGNISVGFQGAGGSGAAPHLFVDNVTLEKVPGIEIALIDLKKAIEAAEAKKATYGIGEGLFQYPESEIEPLTTAIATAQAAYDAKESKAAVEAATEAINTAVEAFAPAMTTPDPEKQYMLQSKQNGLYLTMAAEGLSIAEDPYAVKFEDAGDGTYYITDGEYYVGITGNWDTTSAPETKQALTIVSKVVDEISYYTLGEPKGFIGVDYPVKDNKGCWSNKKETDGDAILWTITEYVEPTEKTIEIAIERFVDQGYGTQTETIDFAEAAEFLGVDAVTNDMFRAVTPTGELDANYATYDGWFNKEGFAQTWGANAFVCVKLWEQIDNGAYSICDMGGDQGAATPEVGDEVTAHWAAVANDKTVYFNFNVTFVEAPAPELAISDVKVKKDVIYDNTVTDNYAEQIAELTDEEIQSILTELGLASLDEAKVYGYNPSDESFVVAYAGFDGWRNTNGDFAMHTGTTDVPACCKYTDGKSYYCYNIAGVGDKIVKTYWAIANDEKAVLVEVDFWFGDAYTGIDGIAADGKAKANGKYLENGKVVIYRNGQKFSTTGVQLK